MYGRPAAAAPASAALLLVPVTGAFGAAFVPGFQAATTPPTPTLKPPPSQSPAPAALGRVGRAQRNAPARSWAQEHRRALLVALALLVPWLALPLAPLFFLARLLYRRALRRRRVAARWLARPPGAHQVDLLLGARPLWVPPRALAPELAPLRDAAAAAAAPGSGPASPPPPPPPPPSEDERLAWANTLLEELWPLLDGAVASAVSQIVQPLLDAARPPFVAALGFERLTLGALPLRLERLRLLDPAPPPAPSSTSPESLGVAVEADVVWAGHANVAFFVDLVAPAGGPSVRLVPRVDDIGLRATVRLALAPAPPGAAAAAAAPAGGGGGGGGGTAPPPALPPLPAALVVSFARPPTLKFSLRFVHAPPLVAGRIVEGPVQTFLDGALRDVLGAVLVWPQRVVVPLAPLLRLGGKGGGEGKGDDDGAPPLLPPDGLRDDEDAALDALHLRSVGLLRVEALAVRRAPAAAAPGTEQHQQQQPGEAVPGAGLGQRLEVEAWTSPERRARLAVSEGGGGGGEGAGGGFTDEIAAAPPASAAAAAAAAAPPGATAATSGGALPAPSAGGGGGAGTVLLVQEPSSQRLRLSLRVADALAAPRALLGGDLAKGAAALFGGAEQRAECVGRASLPLDGLTPAPPAQQQGAAAAAAAGEGAAATTLTTRIVEDWFALSPGDEDWEDIEGAAGRGEEVRRAQEEREGSETTTEEVEGQAGAVTPVAVGAAAAAAAADALPPLQLRLRLTYLPLAPPTPGALVPSSGGVVRVAVRRARGLPLVDGGDGAAPPPVAYAVVEIGAPSAGGGGGVLGADGLRLPASRRRQTPLAPASRDPCWRARFEFGGASLADVVRVAVFARGWWAADALLGEAVVPVGTLLRMGGSGDREGAAALAPLPWPEGRWSERSVGAAEGWAALTGGSGGVGGGGGEVLVRLEYASAGAAAASLL